MLSQNQVLHQGRYRIIHPFGNPDATGLYEAYDTASDTKVVVRERSGNLTSNVTPGQMETLKITFAEQAKRLADMKHEVLLGIRDFFSETGRQYLVLEPFDGQDLSEFIGIDTKPAMSDVIRWADQLLDALEYLHSSSPPVVHQNINPQNIRLTSEFKVKLLLTGTDGLDEVFDHSDSSDGSMNYKALEQLWLGLDYASQKVISNSLDEKSEEILRKPADARTDLYGLAATLYHLLTYNTPADPLARVIDILDGSEDPLVAPHVANPEIPVAISELLMKALEIRREDRFSNAAEMRDALKAMSSTIPSSPVSKPSALAQEAKPNETGQRPLAEQQRLESELEQKRLEKESLHGELKKRELAAQQRLKADAKNGPQVRVSKPAPVATPRPSGVSPLDELKLDLVSDDLLDLPDTGPVVTVTPAPTASNVLSLDSRPVVSEPSFGSSLNVTDKKGGPLGNPLIIVGAVAALLVVVVGGWLVLGSSPSQQANPSAAVITPVQPTPSVQDTTPAADTPVINETVTVSAQPTKTDAERKAEAERKARKTANADVKPTPDNKKKVTVDDLINDN